MRARGGLSPDTRRRLRDRSNSWLPRPRDGPNHRRLLTTEDACRRQASCPGGRDEGGQQARDDRTDRDSHSRDHGRRVQSTESRRPRDKGDHRSDDRTQATDGERLHHHGRPEHPIGPADGTQRCEAPGVLGEAEEEQCPERREPEDAISTAAAMSGVRTWTATASPREDPMSVSRKWAMIDPNRVVMSPARTRSSPRSDPTNIASTKPGTIHSVTVAIGHYEGGLSR